ncbi:hypothetical protein LRS13_11515 [Svornostia abyssi]|uniref:Uncharacterized protein n=1 Tax=Svornostia abyssi TaxID=2898438 RepID=A0ABY5PN22_9ACTN|nr:hypothetical protein LRS13_11515 [Parviterribacteraceae bacterium J379]
MSSGRHPVLLRATALAVTLIALAAGLVLAPSVALLLAPAAALMLLLAHGVFVGEEFIEQLRARRAAARRPRPRAALRPVAPAYIRRTGRRIAFALAVRPPPAPVALSH